LGTTGTASDITERKRAEEALQRSEDTHRLISELTSDYAYTCCVNADGNIEIESVTAGFSRVTGYHLEELRALGGWARLIHPEDLAKALDGMPRLLAGERAVDELRIRTKAGEERWIRYSIQPIWDAGEGRVVRLLGAVQDVTERKRVEAQLQEQAERLGDLSRRLLEVQELERRHLARELHDEIGQQLTGLQYTCRLCFGTSSGMSRRPGSGFGSSTTGWSGGFFHAR